MSKSKIGILGGSFNPPSKGHIDIAKYVLSKTDLNEIWIMPCYNHLFKNTLESSVNRLRMCRIVCSKYTNIYASDYEIKNQLDGSVYNLFNVLSKDTEMSGFDFSFIIGADNVVSFDRWKNAEKLKEKTKFIIIPRQGIIIPDNIVWYKNNPHIYLDEKNPIIEVSSTKIRELLYNWWNCKESKKELFKNINKDVFEYIVKKQLYGNNNAN